jgi:hypothetical protein
MLSNKRTSCNRIRLNCSRGDLNLSAGTRITPDSDRVVTSHAAIIKGMTILLVNIKHVENSDQVTPGKNIHFNPMN